MTILLFDILIYIMYIHSKSNLVNYAIALNIIGTIIDKTSRTIIIVDIIFLDFLLPKFIIFTSLLII
jgi:hypothetical protein